MEERKTGVKNPLKGIRVTDSFSNTNYYTSVIQWYVKWNDLENSSTDGIEKIIKYTEEKWSQAPSKNAKIVPRVYLRWPGKQAPDYWPDDLKTGDYSSDEFSQRAVKLIEKFAQVWDNDPRIAYVNLALIGDWGEHHSPKPTLEIQKALADAYTKYFKNKLIMVRYPVDYWFKNYDKMGLSWDEWGSEMQWSVWDTDKIIAVTQEPFKNRWKAAVFGGENTNNLYTFDANGGRFKTYGLDKGFTADTAFGEKLDSMIYYARMTHTNHLGTTYGNILDINIKNAMDTFQNTLGYNFVIDKANYPISVKQGENFEVSFDIVNTGSSPMYYDWPVALSLLDSSTKKCIWTDVFDNVSVSDWMPGEEWDETTKTYRIPALKYNIKGVFNLPKDIKNGEYIIALTILDPAGMVPAARFAVKNYINGGFTPLGNIGVNIRPKSDKLNIKFSDPMFDTSLIYYNNISFMKKAVANGEEANELVSGKSDIVWTAKNAEKQTIIIDLNKPSEVMSTEIFFDKKVNYQIFVSTDNSIYKQAGRNIYCKNNTVRNIVNIKDIRYIKIEIEKTADLKPVSIQNINIYGILGK